MSAAAPRKADSSRRGGIRIKRRIESQSQARDEDLRWRIALAEKEKLIQRDISARHLVEGSYVAMVPIPADGRPVDHTTTANTGDMHDSSWTGCYLVAAAFRLGWAKKHGNGTEIKKALDLGEQLVHGIDVLTHVSGLPGFLARTVVHGHGPAVEERFRSNSRNEWHQGVGSFSELRYRGHPSHHNYHHVIRGLAFWYYFLVKDNPRPSRREKEGVEKVRSILAEMMEYAYKAHDLMLMDVDGRVSTHLLWDAPQEQQPSTTALMATDSLKFAHWITSDEWYRKKYEDLVEYFGYRRTGNIPPDRWQGEHGRPHAPDHDDTEHTLASLWLACQLEDDPKLREFYRMAVASIFASKRHQKRSPFNYYYASVTGDLKGADLSGALETLQLYPSVTLNFPIMNSIRSDLGPEVRSPADRFTAKSVLPFNQQPLDNAYDWKGDPFSLDGWLARGITSLAISDEDPMVWYLSDAGGTLYQSLDGGRSFSVAEFHQNARVRDVVFAGGKSRIAVLATDRGIFRTDTGGYRNSWQHAGAGPEPNGAHQVIADANNPHVVWAVMDDGTYRSVDLGMEEVGKAWELVSGPMPGKTASPHAQGRGSDSPVYGVGTGPRATMYVALGGRVYRRRAGEPAWMLSPVDAEDYHIVPTARQIAVAPDDPDAALILATLNVWGHDMPVVLRTLDGGEDIRIVGWKHVQPHLASEGSGLERCRLDAVTFDPSHPQIAYGASPKGVYRSTDRGLTWNQCNNGLRIPLAHAVFAPKQTQGTVFASTPAGLHVSTDQGKTWSPPILVLNGPGVDRCERGGLGYLAGYWPGRYLGYVTEEQATASPDGWES